MKGYRFYFDAGNGKKQTRAQIRALVAADKLGNVIAVPLDERNQPFWAGHNAECYASITYGTNGGVACTSCSHGYLTEKCTRIDTDLAFKVHPAMKAYIREDEQ